MIKTIKNWVQSKFNPLRSAVLIFGMLAIILSMLNGTEIRTIYIVGTDTVTVVDTLYREVEKLVQVPAKIDTVFLTVGDDSVLTTRASLDTLLGEDGRLHVDYYYVPKVFDVLWEPLPLEVRCRQLINGEITFSDPNAGLFRFNAGVATGMKWNKKLRVQGLLGVDFKDNGAYITVDDTGWTVGITKRID